MGEPASSLRFSARRLRAWRHVRNLDHPTLADTAGCNVEHVHACETGHTTPRSETLTAWAQALGATPDQLCSHSPDAAGEYWEAASAALPPMTDTEITEVATLLRRSEAEHPARRRHGSGGQPGRPRQRAGGAEPNQHHQASTSDW